MRMKLQWPPGDRCLRRLAPRLIALVLSCLAPGLAVAAPDEALRICVVDVPLPPFFSGDESKPGLTERLLRDAAKGASLQIEFERLPQPRCRALLLKGSIDGMFAAPISVHTESFAFPRLADRQIDRSRRAMTIEYVLVRRAGTSFDWDGREFSPETQPVIGVRRGVSFLMERLTAVGARVDDGASTYEQALNKLVAGRTHLAVVPRYSLQAYLANSKPTELESSKLEALRTQLHTQDFYIAIRPDLDPIRRSTAESFWQEIGRLRDLDAYRVK